MAKKTPYFAPVEAKVDFPEMEKKIFKYWEDNGIVEKYLAKNKNSKKIFSFLDGPITANNPMGVHHAWGRTYKDIFQRYKNMQGYKQHFQNGFDCQGLWVEVEVEKELGIKNKKDLENLVPGDKKKSIEKFVNLCKERVYKYADVQTEQSKRLGYFMDWDNSYMTMSDENNYMIWHFLKVCHENGWVYKGKDSVPWCPRCETAISQHEILGEDYKELTHNSIYFKLPIEGRKGEYLLVWTTTPWTLLANVAVAVDKNLEYSLVKDPSGNNIWIAKDILGNVFGKDYQKIVMTVKGEKLVGLKYEWAFDDLDRVQEAKAESPELFHSVVATNDRIMPITTEEGTGMVHVATGAGTEDFALGKELGLPVLEVIEDDATYLSGFREFSGKNAKDDPWIILGHLKERDKKKDENWIFKIEKYKHRYPACWRCKEELVWKVTREWYIAMDRISRKASRGKNSKNTLRNRMIKVANEMKWIPEFGLKRELDWLNNMNDWLISKKNRYWGLALPIWECTKCGHFEVIGSKEELKENAVEGWTNFEGKTPHKPQIDGVKIKCKICGELASRVEPVGNPWLDAGIAAYSTVSKNNKGEPLYLADKKEWKKWIPADFITESFPGQFKNWFYSLIAMSAALEDIPPTKTVMGFATLFAEDGTPMHKSAGNMIEFNEGADKIGVDVMRFMYAKQSYDQNMLFGYQVADMTRRQFHLMLWNVYRFFVTYADMDGWKLKKGKLKVNNVLDVWMIQRLVETAKAVTSNLDNYLVKEAVLALQDLLNDFSLWYIRRSRDRVGPSVKDSEDKENFYGVCFEVLKGFTQLLAPFNPFIAEEIYINLTRLDSVHLAQWFGETSTDNLTISNDMKYIIPWMKIARKIVELGHAIRKQKQLAVRQPLSSIEVKYYKEKPGDDLLQLIKEELNVKKVEWKVDSKATEPIIMLDTILTLKLKEEGKARELIRNIQKERRKMGLGLMDKILVNNDWIPKDKKVLENIKNKTLAIKLDEGIFKVVRA